MLAFVSFVNCSYTHTAHCSKREIGEQPFYVEFHSKINRLFIELVSNSVSNEFRQLSSNKESPLGLKESQNLLN